jgi:hypothetical protein
VEDAHLVDGLVDILLDLANLLLDFTGLAVRCSFCFQVLVPGQVADSFFRLALHLICLTSHFRSLSSTSRHTPDPYWPGYLSSVALIPAHD